MRMSARVMFRVHSLRPNDAINWRSGSGIDGRLTFARPDRHKWGITIVISGPSFVCERRRRSS